MEVIIMKIKNTFITLMFLCSLTPALFGASGEKGDPTSDGTLDLGSGDFSIGTRQSRQPRRSRTLTCRHTPAVTDSEPATFGFGGGGPDGNHFLPHNTSEKGIPEGEEAMDVVGTTATSVLESPAPVVTPIPTRTFNFTRSLPTRTSSVPLGAAASASSAPARTSSVPPCNTRTEEETDIDGEPESNTASVSPATPVSPAPTPTRTAAASAAESSAASKNSAPLAAPEPAPTRIQPQGSVALALASGQRLSDSPGQPKKSFWSKALLPVGIIGIAAAVIATNYLSERYLGRPVVKDFARDTYQNLQPYASPIIGGLVKGISCVGRGLLSFGRSAFGALKNLKSTKLPSFGSFFSRS